MVTIRCLRETDLGDCLRLKNAAGWNQTEADWRAVMAAAPEGCFGVEVEGRVEATATAVAHAGVGWVGMVLTNPEYRGRGFARALMQRALGHLDERVETIKLDATTMGEPLYRQLGFVEECPIERWVGEVAEGAVLTGRYAGPLRHAAIPMEAVAECEGAWGAGRAGGENWYFGPCYGTDTASVERVARVLLAGRGRAYWDLFPAHPAAAVATRLGFAPARRLLRMVRGKAVATPADVYAIAGFEWG
jgi:GNAT superfamily N-acetyltransferase